MAKATDLRSNSVVAIKRIQGVFDDASDCRRVLREITLMRLFDHPNVTKLIDVIVPDDLESFEELYIVMEYCHSDLSKLVNSKIKLDLKQVKFILSNLLHGLKHLHNREVAHRDFKPGNILVNKDCTTKICDFGFARSLHGVNKQSSQVLEQCQSNGIVEKL